MVMPVTKSKKSLEAMRYKEALYYEISCLVFKSHHFFSVNPTIMCFVVVNHFDYFSQFCNISGACIIDTVKPTS